MYWSSSPDTYVLYVDYNVRDMAGKRRDYPLSYSLTKYIRAPIINIILIYVISRDN